MLSVLKGPKALLMFGAVLITADLATTGVALARKPAPVAPPPPPPPPPAAVQLSERALLDASAFRAYAYRAETLSGAFTTGDGVEQSLAVGAAYEPQQLARGAIAYAALLALQDPTFYAAVRTYAVDPDQRRTLAARIVADPHYATAFPGVASAAGLIIATMGVESTRIDGVAAKVKQSAYSVQHSPWSKQHVLNPEARLQQTKTLSAALMSPAPNDVDQLKLALNGGGDPQAAQVLGAHGQPVTGPYTAMVEHGIALAAVAALGQAGDDNQAAVDGLTADATGGACLNMSKLNLYQCLAVAVPWYEDIFCLGQHALDDTAQCISKDAGTAQQIQQAVAVPTGAGSAASTAVAVAALSAPATGLAVSATPVSATAAASTAMLSGR